MFYATENKGFQITFANGYSISCQFGGSNYCERYHRHLEPDYEYQEEMKTPIVKSHDCEVAIWDKSDNWITGTVMDAVGIDPTEDAVQANVTPDEVARIISYLVAMKA